MKNKIFSLEVIAVLIIMLFSLTGCGNEKSNNTLESKKIETENIFENKTEGKLSEIITAKNYGESVNYTANNFSNWKIFYNDGENVFIIAGKNIPSTYAPKDIGLVLQDKYMGGEEVCWDSDTLIYSGIPAIKSDVIDKYLFSWAKDYPNSENYTAKAIASLLDTSKWTSFVDSNVADSAIGTPTVDMFIESWNQVEERKFYYDKSNEYGYFINENENADNYDCSIFNKPEIEEGKGNDFYLINKDVNYGYWLAGSCAKGEEWMLAVDKYGIDYADSWMAGNGLRPVICLNAETNGKLVDGIWEIEGKTNNKGNKTDESNAEELKIGNTAIKYGTYTGIDGATGNTLVINKDNTATLNGTNYTYKVGKYNFAQDSSSDSYKDAIIFLTNTGDTSFALYVSDNGSLNDDPMCYVYKDN